MCTRHSHSVSLPVRRHCADDGDEQEHAEHVAAERHEERALVVDLVEGSCQLGGVGVERALLANELKRRVMG